MKVDIEAEAILILVLSSTLLDLHQPLSTFGKLEGVTQGVATAQKSVGLYHAAIP